MLSGTNYVSNPLKPAVALSGRVPVKVNLEGGEIGIGDKIALSSVSGVGMKAVESGTTVGIALESFPNNSNTGEILVFVNLGYSKLDEQIQGDEIVDGSLWSVDSSSGRIKYMTGLDLNGFDFAALFHSIKCGMADFVNLNCPVRFTSII